ncbi:hypothetical protein BJX62DRAFT_238559 [Aspergillus germanicus]
MADQTSLTKCTKKPRVFVISDISNEPDDAESLMQNNVHPEGMHKIVNAYAEVVDNLNFHVHPR